MKLNGRLKDNCLRGGQKKCCRSQAGSFSEGPQVCSRGQRAAGSDLSGEASSLMRELSLGSVEPNVACSIDKVLCISLQENINSLFLILKFVTHFNAEKLRCDSMMPLCKKNMNYSWLPYKSAGMCTKKYANINWLVNFTDLMYSNHKKWTMQVHP